MQRSVLAAALLLLHTTLGGAAGEDDPLAAPRAQFQQAMRQLDNPATAATGDSAGLRDYVLFPYLEAARLQQALTVADANVAATLDQEVEAFLRAHDSEPVAQDLRRAWLGSLAARGGWDQFLAFHRPAVDDATLRCHGFTARIALGRDTDLAAQVAQAWLTPRSLQECDRAFTWLNDTGALTPALIEQRVRAALAAGNAGFARQIVARLPAGRAAPLLQWAALLDNPQREIDALIAGPRAPVEPDALLAGWTKLARANRAAARQRFERLVRARHMNHREASPFALALGLALSWDRDPEALKYFARVEAGDYDDTAREWHARAALWAGDWKLASRNIAAMSEGSRRTARWRYWAARVAALEGQEAAARALYESILTEDNYYSAMAAARLKRPIAPNPQGVTVDPAVLEGFEARPAFLRARELLRAGMEDKARMEWSLGHSQLPASARPQTIQLAVRWGWYHQAVAVATGERVFNDYTLLYPRPYDAEVDAAAKVSGLPPTLIYSVIRQESLFQRDAVSSADARGLMQLLPATARNTARAWNLPAPSPTDLFDPATNVMLGAAHVKELLDRYGGRLPLALAGYNAGPGAVQRWLPAAPMDPDIWIENIPYNETRNYVQRIHWHSVVFGWLASGEAQDTQGWLGAVKP